MMNEAEEKIVVQKSFKQKLAKNSYNILMVAYLVIILLITYTPIIVMALNSISTSKTGSTMNGVTFEWYGKIFAGGELTKAVTFTLEITLLSTIISTVFGTISAIGINALSKKAKKRIILLNNVPILNADIVTAVFLFLIFSIISNILKVNITDKYGFITTLIAHVLFSTPYVVLSVLPKLSKDNSLYDAARDLGCSPAQALINVVIPNIKSGIFSGMMLAFTMSIDDFVITYFVCGSKNKNFSIWLMSTVNTTNKGSWPQACAYNTLLMLITFTCVIGYQIVSAKKGEKKKNEK